MTVAELLAVIKAAGGVCLALMAIGGFVAVIVRWAVLRPTKDFIKSEVGTQLGPIAAQLQNNGGSSLLDKVEAIADRQAEQHIENRNLVFELRADVINAGINIPEE